MASAFKLPDLGEGLTEGEGEIASVGTELVVIGEPAEAPNDTLLQGPETAVARRARPSDTVSQGQSATASVGRVQATPVVRRIAQELGVELAEVAGSGPGGRITDDDVRAAASGGAA